MPHNPPTKTDIKNLRIFVLGQFYNTPLVQISAKSVRYNSQNYATGEEEEGEEEEEEEEDEF